MEFNHIFLFLSNLAKTLEVLGIKLKWTLLPGDLFKGWIPGRPPLWKKSAHRVVQVKFVLGPGRQYILRMVILVFIMMGMLMVWWRSRFSLVLVYLSIATMAVIMRVVGRDSVVYFCISCSQPLKKNQRVNGSAGTCNNIGRFFNCSLPLNKHVFRLPPPFHFHYHQCHC